MFMKPCYFFQEVRELVDPENAAGMEGSFDEKFIETPQVFNIASSTPGVDLTKLFQNFCFDAI